MNKENIIKAIEELRKNEKRKFDQSIDLLINLKNFDIKRESINLFLTLPHKVKEKKIAAFLNKRSNAIDTIAKAEFDSYKDKKKIKRLVKEYDFFISHASLMPAVAASFGRYLGTAGKMPSPQLGILKTEEEKEIKETIERFERIVKIKSKEPSLKFCIGKESMKDSDIAENVIYACNAIENALSKKKENIRSIMLRFTMTKPVKLAF